MRRVWITGALPVVALVSLAVMELWPSARERMTGGPLACPAAECGRTATGGPVRIGTTASFGALTLRNDTDDPVTLEQVVLIDVDPGLQLVGVIVVEPDGRHALVGSARGFPPAEPGGATYRVPGYELKPAKSDADFIQILIGLRLLSTHRSGARRIAVDYSVGNVPYRATFEHSMWLCADPKDSNGCIDPNR